MADDDATTEENETTHENAAELLNSGIAELERAGTSFPLSPIQTVVENLIS